MTTTSAAVFSHPPLRPPLRQTSPFGRRCAPEATECVEESHEGNDLAAAPDEPVFAPGDGVVAARWEGGAGGRQMLLLLDNGWRVGFAHLNGWAVARGQRVRAGDVVAYAGFTGRVWPPGPAGSHVHRTLRPPAPGSGFGAKVDAWPHLKRWARGGAAFVAGAAVVVTLARKFLKRGKRP